MKWEENHELLGSNQSRGNKNTLGDFNSYHQVIVISSSKEGRELHPRAKDMDWWSMKWEKNHEVLG